MNIAVVGSGYWGTKIVEAYSELNSLYSIYEKNTERRKELSVIYPDVVFYDTYEELLNDKFINGVVIATPVTTHFELAKKSLEAGFLTFVEKPMTLNLSDAEYLTDLANLKQIPLMVGHILEYHPAINKMKELIDSGSTGKIKHIRCSRVNLGKIREHESVW